MAVLAICGQLKKMMKMKTETIIKMLTFMESINIALTREMSGDLKVNAFLTEMVKFQTYLEDILDERTDKF